MKNSLTRYVNVLVLSILAASTAQAQDQLKRPSVSEAVRQFNMVGEGAFPSTEYPAAGWLASVALQPRAHPAATVDSVLAGLQDLAVSGGHAAVRRRAIIWLRQAGDTALQDPVAGIVQRLTDVFRQSRDPISRQAILQWMPAQAERMQAVAFMEEVATQDDPLDRGSDWPAPLLAVDGLLRMGSTGVGALRRLHATQAVVNPLARERLAAAAKAGFRDPGQGQ